MPCRCRPLARPGVSRPAHTPRPATSPPAVPMTPNEAPVPAPTPTPTPAGEETTR